MDEDRREDPGRSMLPSFWDGINWYCYTVIFLLFVTDLTPVGLLLASGPDAGLYFAAMQWALFVAPTVWQCQQKGWDLRQTFLLNTCSVSWCVKAAAAGCGLWLATAWVISAKAGVPLFNMSGAGAAPEVQRILFGDLLERPTDLHQLAKAAGLSALSPACAEELLFRGFLLSALSERLGRVDAVAVSAALFALAHLSVPQFFGLTILGAACGGVAASARSLLPAVALHTAYNCTALAVGLASVAMAQSSSSALP